MKKVTYPFLFLMIKMKKNKTIIELYAEKTENVVRVIRFRKSKDLNEFLKGFREMRYPGYGWRYKKKQENHE